uniref:Uncharacterized protein n=1 Tax=Onchocerca volvulus TaxID=6282 RepID=A0A8R1XRN4_ONCVO
MIRKFPDFPILPYFSRKESEDHLSNYGNEYEIERTGNLTGQIITLTYPCHQSSPKWMSRWAELLQRFLLTANHIRSYTIFHLNLCQTFHLKRRKTEMCLFAIAYNCTYCASIEYYIKLQKKDK